MLPLSRCARVTLLLSTLVAAAVAPQALLIKEAKAESSEKKKVAVGAFEGANGYAKGMFRSEVNCIMFSLQTDYFCAACTSAIERMIAWHAR